MSTLREPVYKVISRGHAAIGVAGYPVFVRKFADLRILFFDQSGGAGHL